MKRTFEKIPLYFLVLRLSVCISACVDSRDLGLCLFFFWLFLFQFHERVEEDDQECLELFSLECQKEAQQQDESMRSCDLIVYFSILDPTQLNE